MHPAEALFACVPSPAPAVASPAVASPADALDTYRARVAAIDVGQTRAVADALLDPGRAAIVLLGPADALAPQFQGLGPVEVVQP